MVVTEHDIRSALARANGDQAMGVMSILGRGSLQIARDTGLVSARTARRGVGAPRRLSRLGRWLLGRS